MATKEELETLIEDVKDAEMNIYSRITPSEVERMKERIRELEEPNYDHIELSLEDYGGYWESEEEE